MAAAATAYPSAEGWNRSQANIRPGSAVKRGPSRSPRETVQPPAETTATVWAAASWRLHRRASQRSGGWMGRIVPRSGQVPTTTSAPAARSARTPRRGVARPDRGGTVCHVVAADQDDRDVRVALQSRLDLELEAGGDGTDHRKAAQPHRALKPPGQPGGQQGAGRLPAAVHAVACGGGVAEDDQVERRAGELGPVDPVTARWRCLGHRDGAAGLTGLTEQNAGGGGRSRRGGAGAERGQSGHPPGALQTRTVRYDRTNGPHRATLARRYDVPRCSPTAPVGLETDSSGYLIAGCCVGSSRCTWRGARRWLGR